jgi:hypothetical protein
MLKLKRRFETVFDKVPDVRYMTMDFLKRKSQLEFILRNY